MRLILPAAGIGRMACRQLLALPGPSSRRNSSPADRSTAWHQPCSNRWKAAPRR